MVTWYLPKVILQTDLSSRAQRHSGRGLLGKYQFVSILQALGAHQTGF